MDFDLNNSGLNDLLKHISKLMDESDRRYKDANKKVSKYMLLRMKSLRNSVRLLCSINNSVKQTFDQDTFEKLLKIAPHIDNLVTLWEEKYQESAENRINIGDLTKLKLVPVQNGLPGRPAYHIDFELLDSLREYHFNLTTIAKIFGIDRVTLWRKMNNQGYDFSCKYSDTSEDELDIEVAKIKQNHPLAGEKMVCGILRSKGYHLQRWRVRASIHRVDPINTVKRWLQRNPRWVYSVPGPNSLWHNDGLHKLISWGFVIHACIDGYSRMVTSLLCATNNYARTALKGFLKGVSSFGLPARVRGDRGGENVLIMRYMRDKQGYEGAYIQGTSVHNQRIERLHYDTTHCVLTYFIDLFKFMEEIGCLHRDMNVDRFALHFVYVPRIQNSLNEFQEGWNQHKLSTESNQTPYQLWLLGMMDNDKQEQRGVRRFYTDTQDELFGVDVSSNLNCMPDDLTLVEVHDVTLRHDTDILEILKSEFNPLHDDGNHGISCFKEVKRRVMEILEN